MQFLIKWIRAWHNSPRSSVQPGKHKRSLLLSVAGLLPTVFIVAAACTPKGEPGGRVVTRVREGETFPRFALKQGDGKSVRVDTIVERNAALLLFMTAEDCLSCARYTYETFYFSRPESNISVRIVLVDSDTAFAREVSRRHRIQDVTLFDPDKAATSSMGLKTPSAVLVAAGGKVVLIDSRSAVAYGKYPMSEKLSDVVSILTPTSRRKPFYQ